MFPDWKNLEYVNSEDAKFMMLMYLHDPDKSGYSPVLYPIRLTEHNHLTVPMPSVNCVLFFTSSLM